LGLDTPPAAQSTDCRVVGVSGQRAGGDGSAAHLSKGLAMRIFPSIISAIALVATGGSAHAISRTGSYLLTIEHAHPKGASGSTACLTLTDNGSYLGYASSGPATIAGSSVSGDFFVAGSTLYVTAALANNGSLTITARVNGTELKPGVLFEVVGGSPLAGIMTWGDPGSC